MKKSFLYLIWLGGLALTLYSCTKEVSEENGILNGTAAGTLTDTLGNCKKSIIKGDYVMDLPLTDSNYVIANVNFTATGKYKIYSDTANGMWFLDSGFVTTTGATTVKLKGKGTPLLPGTTEFVLMFGNSTCRFSVNVTGPNNGSSTTDYLPVTPNGYITYEFIGDILNGDTVRRTISPNTYTTSLSTRSFYRYVNAPFVGESYYTKQSGTYYTIGTPEVEFFYIYDTIYQNKVFEYIYLKDNVPAASTWTTDTLRVGIIPNAANPTAITWGAGRLKFTILSTGGIASFLGTTYKDIIKVKREMEFKPDGSTTYQTLTISAELSYAKGIGLVDQYINLGSGSSQSVTIKKFSGL